MNVLTKHNDDNIISYCFIIISMNIYVNRRKV